MAQSDDMIFMRRCLDLAGKAEGNTSPNPLVGAVIVHDGKIIGEGYHLETGTPHAEVHAINAVADRSLLPHSTLYVSLEPCSHQGRTPPCADLIVRSGIQRVVIGTGDTSLKVAGKGIERMRQAGIDVVVGVLEEECRVINRRFFTSHEKQRPYVILKWARSADGFIDTVRAPGEAVGPHWITGMSERILVHRWRAAEDAILAGGSTVRSDNPSLDIRFWKGRNPLRVIVSRSGNIDPQAKVLNETAGVLLFTRNSRVTLPGAKIIQLSDDKDIAGGVLNVLHDMEVQSLLVEGGAFIIRTFFGAGLWDEARRFTGQENFGNGVPDPFTGFIPEQSIHFEKSILEIMHHFRLNPV
jgi:diaminohydroxyphosphoribosylaminopyrimidine deaminase/5-amino-6-(5-phosphoribosylamino)uracil reductase